MVLLAKTHDSVGPVPCLQHWLLQAVESAEDPADRACFQLDWSLRDSVAPGCGGGMVFTMVTWALALGTHTLATYSLF